MPVIAFVGHKGGTGKSTLAILLAAELHRRKKTVLLFDGDAHQTCGRWWSAVVAAGRDAPKVERYEGHLLRREQLDAYVADRTAVDARDVFGIIDAPSQDEVRERAALRAADLVLIPLAPTGIDRPALDATIDRAFEARALRPWLKAYFLAAKCSQKVKRPSDCFPYFDASLGNRAAYPQAIAAGTAIKKRGEVEALANEVLARLPQRSALHALGDSTMLRDDVAFENNWWRASAYLDALIRDDAHE